MFLQAFDWQVFGILTAGLAVWFATSLYWAMVCRYVAREKDRQVETWTLLGFFGWWLAFLPLAVVPDLSEYEEIGID